MGMGAVWGREGVKRGARRTELFYEINDYLPRSKRSNFCFPVQVMMIYLLIT